jgi:hypothetical protein
LLWYFSRLSFGPIQTNYLTNGNFESGTTGWTASGTTMSAATDIFADGATSLKLVQANQGTDTYAYQDFTFNNSGAGTIPQAMEVSARMYIVATVTSARVYPKNTFYVIGLAVSLATAGTTTTTVAVLKNGSSLGSVSLGSGVHYGYTGDGTNAAITATVINGRTDYYQIQITAVGSGSSDLGGGIEIG